MSQLQQKSSGQSQVEEGYTGRLREHLQSYEAFLLSEIFRKNGREGSVSLATPPGYRYVREEVRPSVLPGADGPIIQIAAHPGDGPDFFYATYLLIAANTAYCNDYYEILLTNGERGVDGWCAERTRQARVEEAYAGAEIVGSKLRFLGYPDGGLSSLTEEQRAQLVTELADIIGNVRPALLVVHPPKNDHPDHAHSFLLTLAALELNTQRNRKRPALYVHDVEFGLQQKTLWTARVTDPRLHFYPLHSPDFLVDISSTHRIARYVLSLHKTQMYDPVQGQPKLYADLIDTLAQVRGLQFVAEETLSLPLGQGFSQIILPNVTEEQNNLLFRLPAGSMYRRVEKDARKAFTGAPFSFRGRASLQKPT